MKLSVAMCTYNGAPFLPEQLASIAAQTRRPDELVVCDDASTDTRTVAILEQFAAGASFPVRLFRNPENLGSTRNFDQAIALCAGDLISLADQDDVWHPVKLERLEAGFAGAEDVGLVFSDAAVVDERLRILTPSLWRSLRFEGRPRDQLRQGQAFDLLLRANVVAGATMAFRAGLRGLLLPIPVNTYMLHDGWIAVMAAAACAVRLVEEPLLSYRQHVGQQIGLGHVAPYDDQEYRVSPLLRSLLSARPYAREMCNLEAVRERLAARSRQFPVTGSLRTVEARIAHTRSLRGRLELRARVLVGRARGLSFRRVSRRVRSAWRARRA